MSGSKKILALGAVAGAGVLGAAAGVRSLGARIAATTDHRIDPLLTTPDDVTHHRVQTYDGGAVHVAERGEGPAVVLLHGVTLRWDIWSPLMRLLGEDHRVLAWDMRGHGESVAGDAGVSLDAIATDLVTVLAELDVEDAVVVGHSMGGMALGRFLVEHGATARRRVGHAVFLATSAAPMHPLAHDPDTVRHQAAIALATAGMGNRVRYDWREGNLSRVVVRRAFGRTATGAAVEQVRSMTAEMPPEPLSQAAHSIIAHDIRDALAANRVPSSVITGTLDLLTPPRHGRILADSLGDAQLHLLDGIGHQVMQEDPHTLADLLRGPAVTAPGGGG